MLFSYCSASECVSRLRRCCISSKVSHLFLARGFVGRHIEPLRPPKQSSNGGGGALDCCGLYYLLMMAAIMMGAASSRQSTEESLKLVEASAMLPMLRPAISKLTARARLYLTCGPFSGSCARIALLVKLLDVGGCRGIFSNF